jgi:hypothetical protein
MKSAFAEVGKTFLDRADIAAPMSAIGTSARVGQL